MCGEDFVIVNSMSVLFSSLFSSSLFLITYRVDVSQTGFDRIDREREIRRRKFRFFFQADKRQLCVTLPSGPHEGMHATLFDAICAGMIAHPPMPPWYPCAARVYSHPNGTSCKEADSGGFPGHGDTSGGDARWPALVIECGMNQSLASLHAAMRWWFSASGHRVKIVLVVKLHRSTHTIAMRSSPKSMSTVLAALVLPLHAASAHVQPLCVCNLSCSRRSRSRPSRTVTQPRTMLLAVHWSLNFSYCIAGRRDPARVNETLLSLKKSWRRWPARCGTELFFQSFVLLL